MRITKRRNIKKMIELYKTIGAYIHEYGEPPTMAMLVNFGYATSPSVISYYFDELAELGMAERTPRGSVRLMPLENASPAVHAAMEQS
jgi:SOS-response transcriptional repressor LexA